MVQKAAELGISVLAITDHDSVADIGAFRAAALNSGVTVFPGFEIESREGIHVLCIFDPSTPSERLSNYLAAFETGVSEESTGLSSHYLAEILAKVRGQGGIAIAAHVECKKGLLYTLTGKARVKAWRDSNLLAVQIHGGPEEVEAGLRQILRNRDAQHRREQPASRDLALAVVNANDTVVPDDLEHPNATCWIKMARPSAEGLRQAFLDPGSRIRLHSDGGRPAQSSPVLRSIRWAGGFLDGVECKFNPNLNVIIGGRGAGKSTIVESLRYVLDLQPVGSEAQRAHTGIVGDVLIGGSKITLEVEVQTPTVSAFRVERTVHGEAKVFDAANQVSHLQPSDLLPGIGVYGQHEIAEIARSPKKCTSLLHRFIEGDQTITRRKNEVKKSLAKNRKELLDLRSSRESISGRLAAMPALAEKLTMFRAAGVEDFLSDKELIVKEEAVLDSTFERLGPFRESLETLKEALPVDRTFLSPNALKDLPRQELLNRANAVIQLFSEAFLAATAKMQSALASANRDLEQIKSKWAAQKSKSETEFQQKLRELGKGAKDAQNFVSLSRELEQLRPESKKDELLQRAEEEFREQRTALLCELHDLAEQEFRLLAEAAKKVSRSLRDRVRIRVQHSGDRGPLKSLLEDQVTGRKKEAIETICSDTELSVRALAADCRSGAATLQSRYEITDYQARSLAGMSEEALMEIEELILPPTSEILLNTAAGDDSPLWHTMEELSTGQKATAVLLLLLLESEAPLIVDQPEDDLDNRFVTESVVPRIRDAKQRRQFVFSTHNANIPVLGDAELILGLTPGNEFGVDKAGIKPEHAGSIDFASIRVLIESLLEGGKSAFELRRRKYGF